MMAVARIAEVRPAKEKLCDLIYMRLYPLKFHQKKKKIIHKMDLEPICVRQTFSKDRKK